MPSLIGVRRSLLTAKPALISGGSGIGTLPITSNLLLRLHANAGITLNGSTVSQWLDQSATAAAFAQATTGNQPTLVANVYNAGTKPTVRFGGSHWLAMSAYLASINITVGTMYVIWKATGSSSTDKIVYDSSDDTAKGFRFVGNDHNGSYNFEFFNSGTNQTSAGSVDTNLHMFAIQMEGTSADIWKDGSNINSNATASLQQQTTLPAVVGSSAATPGGTGLSANGDLCEILLYGGAFHTSTQIGTMRTSYGQTEWGTP